MQFGQDVGGIPYHRTLPDIVEGMAVLQIGRSSRNDLRLLSHDALRLAAFGNLHQVRIPVEMIEILDQGRNPAPL